MFVQDITDELQNYQSVILALQEQAAALGEQVRSRSDVTLHVHVHVCPMSIQYAAVPYMYMYINCLCAALHVLTY